MERLTAKEEEVLGFFWKHGPLYVKEIVDKYADPKPHFNTISTQIRILEDKGFVSHNVVGGAFQYYAVVGREQFIERSFSDIVRSFFNNSYKSAVSALVEEEKISVDELRQIIDMVEKQSKK